MLMSNAVLENTDIRPPTTTGSMGETTFRQAKPWDGKAILRTKRVAIEHIDDDSYDSEQLAAWKPDEDALEEFKRAIRSDRFDVLVAERQDDIVGYGVLNVADGRIDAVFVHPESAGEGVGRSLVRQFETRAQMHGITDLAIVSSLNARSFYESLGYEPRDRKPREIAGTELEFVIVTKTFDL